MEGKRPSARRGALSSPSPGPFPFLLPTDKDICQHTPRAFLWRARTPCPHQGELFIVWAPGREPGPPDKGRAVIYSGRCALLGVVGESGEGGPAGARGPSAGRTTPRGRGPPGPAAAAAARLRRAQDAARVRPHGSWLSSSAFFPPPPPPTTSKEKEGGGRERPPLRLEGVCAPPAAAAAAPGRAGGWRSAGLRRRRRVWSCFWTAFNSGGKKHLSQGTKKKKKKWGWGGKELKKNSKA